MMYGLQKFIFRSNETLPSARKLLLWQVSWIIPYLLLANYLERNLFPLRVLCYTQRELLNVPHGEKVDLKSCLRRFFLSTGQKFNAEKKCMYEEPVGVLIAPRISRYLNRISVVRSAPSSRKYRNYIRETWKSDMEPDIPVIFALGTGDYNPKREASIYHDIIQFDFIDSYFNLTLKMISVYKHFFKSLSHLREIVVINDDAIVNATAIKKMNSVKGTSLRGKVSRGYPRLFLSSMLWYVPYEMYPNLCYPPFVQGSSFIITREAAQRVVDSICSFPQFKLDDILMGILASCLSINMEHSEGFDEYDLTNSFVVFHYQWLRYSVAQLYFLYQTKFGNS